MKAFIQSANKSTGKLVVQALVPFTELKDKALFTQKELSLTNAGQSNKFDVKMNSEYYQRRLDRNKLRSIQKFIINSILDEHDNITAISTLFPSSMILAAEWDGDMSSDVIDIQLCDNVYVVDGQHRLMAMKQVYEDFQTHSLFYDNEVRVVLDYLQSYKFNCTILLNYDLWEQSQVFANVNFTQKPVNRSLYYEIFGTEYIDNPKDWSKNYIYLAHQLTKFMNEAEKSPYCGKIKMLGSGEGYVSQAFFVEALTRHFKSGRIWGRIPSNSKEASKTLDYIKVELISYFAAVKASMSKYWGVVTEGKLNFISKTTGTGAFMRLLEDVHSEIYEDLEDEIKANVSNQFCMEYYTKTIEILKPLSSKLDIYFGADSKYGGTGGKGLEVKLYDALRNDLLINKMIKDTPILKMSREEHIKAVANVRDAKIRGELFFHKVDFVEEELSKWANTQLPPEIEILGNHCSVESIESLQYQNSQQKEDRIQYFGVCRCQVRIALDSEEESVSTMTFPSKFTFEIKRSGDKWEIDNESITMQVNTSRYYL